MENNQRSNWKRIWENRKNNSTGTTPNEVLESLILMDGFDSKSSYIKPQEWMHYSVRVLRELGVRPGESVFEIGCGAGAFLYSLYLAGYSVGGIDYSANMVEEAHKHLIGMDITVCEASLLDVNDLYDAVIANSSFSYFNDYDYAHQVMERMLTKSKNAVAILDIPDKQSTAKSESIRGASVHNYSERYKDTQHLYYDHSFFYEFAQSKSLDVKIVNQQISEYGYNSVRFNCFLWKKQRPVNSARVELNGFET